MIRAVAALLATAAVAGAAAAAPGSPSYRVAVTATLQELATYELTGDAACFWTARGVAVRHLDIASVPTVVTAAELARGVGLVLRVREIRLANHNNVTGACARLGPEVSDPSDRCGKRAYTVSPADVHLSLAAGRVGFAFLRVAADPYGNRCAPAEWAAIPRTGYSQPVATLRFPPRQVAIPVDERRLASGKAVTAAWQGTVSTTQPTFGRTDVSTASWRVTLTSVQG